MKIPESDVIELRTYYTWMGNDGIARTKIKLLAEVTIDDAIENSIAVNSLSRNGENYPLLIDSTGVKSMTKESRDYFSMNNRASNVTAFAIIISSPVSRIVGNFFMGLNKPRVPAKLFSNEEDALVWLKNIRDIK